MAAIDWRHNGLGPYAVNLNAKAKRRQKGLPALQ